MNTADAMFDLWEVHPMTMKYFRETTDNVYYKRRYEERNFTQYVLYDGYMGFTTKASADGQVVPYHIEAKYWKTHTEIENSDASWASKQKQYYRAYRNYVYEVEEYRDHVEMNYILDIAEYKPSKDGSERLTTVNTIKMPYTTFIQAKDKLCELLEGTTGKIGIIQLHNSYWSETSRSFFVLSTMQKETYELED